MTEFDMSKVPHHWRLGGDGKWLRGPKAAYDAVNEQLSNKEADMTETSIEDLRRIAQKLRQTLDYDDLAALAGMLTTSDNSADQEPDALAKLPENEVRHALDRMTPAARRIWHERQQRRHASNLEAGLKRWPQAKRLGL